MTRSFPLAGRADGGKRKEPHDGIKSSHTDTTETRADFCVHAALGRLRFVSGSTAQLLYLVDFSISGTGVRVKIHSEKSVRVREKFTRARALDWDFRKQLYRKFDYPESLKEAVYPPAFSTKIPDNFFTL